MEGKHAPTRTGSDAEACGITGTGNARVTVYARYLEDPAPRLPVNRIRRSLVIARTAWTSHSCRHSSDHVSTGWPMNSEIAVVVLSAMSELCQPLHDLRTAAIA
jgi:hypothetical protein